MQRETQGWFVFHTIWANANNTYSLSTAFKVLYKYQLNPTAFLIVLGAGACYYARSCPDLWLPVIYLGATFLSLLTVGKDGAADIYFLENYAALCLCGGIAYQRLCAQADFRNPVSALLPATLAAFVMLNLHFPQAPATYRMQAGLRLCESCSRYGRVIRQRGCRPDGGKDQPCQRQL
jgi:hypothetical protein